MDEGRAVAGIILSGQSPMIWAPMKRDLRATKPMAEESIQNNINPYDVQTPLITSFLPLKW